MTKPKLNEGEIYAGAIINPDGTGHHIILLAAIDNKTFTWKQAMELAKEAGGDLPNRVESALLFNQLKDQSQDQSQETWYWTNEQHASLSGFAWFHNFYNGNQCNYHKSNELRARAVRRVEIKND